jgi:hypothetical protein
MPLLSYWLNHHKLVRGLYQCSEILCKNAPMVWNLNLLGGLPENDTLYVNVEDSDCVTELVFSCIFLVYRHKCFKVYYVCFIEMVRDVRTVVTSWLISCYIPQERCCSLGWIKVQPENEIFSCWCTIHWFFAMWKVCTLRYVLVTVSHSWNSDGRGTVQCLISTLYVTCSLLYNVRTCN